MKILIVNDDSIDAPGIVLLAKAAMELGEVWVVAPAEQCSAMSMRLTLGRPVRVERVTDFPVPVMGAYHVGGTPVDCVKVALHHILKEKPDVVFSGINDGYNIGFDIAHSGTVGAAFEAAMHGIPAIAFSSEARKPMTEAERQLVPIARELLAAPLSPGAVWNVNFPSGAESPARGILRDRTVAQAQLFRECYRAEALPGGAEDLTLWGVPLTAQDSLPAGSDMEAVLNGWISIGTVRSAVL